jgi:long-chain acyl-CoA synthetase
MLVHEFLIQSAQRRPEQIGLVCAGRRFSFAELDQMSNQVAQALILKGITRGDRVVIYLPNCVEAVVGIFGVLKAGGVFVMVNPTTKREKFNYLLQDSGAAGVLTDGGLISEFDAPAFPALKATMIRERQENKNSVSGSSGLSFASVFADSSKDAPPRLNIDLDLACLIYTSGSTGEAKGVMCDHSNVVFVTQSIVAYLGNDPSDVVLSVLPLSFSYGLYQLMAAMCSGGRLVLEESFTFPAVILKRIAAEGVTGFAGVPTIYAILLGLDLGLFDLSSLRYLTNAAAALPVDHVRRLRNQFPKAALFLMHGLTEVARTVYLSPKEVDARPSSVGRAIPGTEVWIVDQEGRRAAVGEVGEMVVRGRHVMRGYWNNADATQARFRSGPIPGERLCYTGDLFRTDEEGLFYFVARKDDIIKSRGEKVSPREIENVLYTMPGVREVAVIGVPDPVFGQAIKAFIVAPGRALTPQDVMSYCKAHLEDLMVPKFVEFLEALPKTESGKIRKLELR